MTPEVEALIQARFSKREYHALLGTLRRALNAMSAVRERIPELRLEADRVSEPAPAPQAPTPAVEPELLVPPHASKVHGALHDVIEELQIAIALTANDPPPPVVVPRPKLRMVKTTDLRRRRPARARRVKR